MAENMDIDLLDLLEREDIPTDYQTTQEAMSALGKLATKIDSLNREEEELQEQLKRVAAEKRVLVEEVMPSLMTSNGITSLKLDDGRSISYKEEYFAHISEDKKPYAFQWFEDHGLADIIKNKYEISFTRGQSEEAEKFERLIAESGNPYTNKRDVHPSTLKSVVNRLIAEGEMPPQDIFGIYQKRSVVIRNN